MAAAVRAAKAADTVTSSPGDRSPGGRYRCLRLVPRPALFLMVGIGAAYALAAQSHTSAVENQREVVRSRIEPVRA